MLAAVPLRRYRGRDVHGAIGHPENQCYDAEHPRLARVMAGGMIDLEEKRAFLSSGALLYHSMIKVAEADVVRRRLAFHIIVNAVSFEDLMGVRMHLRMRELRDALLSQTGRHDLLEGYDAGGEICDSTIRPLIAFMCSHLSTAARMPPIPELADPEVCARFQVQVGSILSWYSKMHGAATRTEIDPLWQSRNQVSAQTATGIAHCLSRYNASKALMTLGMYLINGLNYDPGCAAALLHAKLDVVMHAVNMVECVFETDTRAHSIPRLHEMMRAERVGTPDPLDALAKNFSKCERYGAVRQVCAKIADHMNWAIPLHDLLVEANALALEDVYDMVRAVDLAVHSSVASSQIIRTEFSPIKTHRTKGPICHPTGSYYH